VPHWLDAIKEELVEDSTSQILRENIQQGEAVGPWKEIDGIIFFKDHISSNKFSTSYIDH